MSTSDISLTDQVLENIKIYGQSVISNRAVPDYRDGLKPVHRRVLWAMYGLGLHHNTAYKKSARVVGDVIGLYHPHSDTGSYDALAGMVAQIPEPLIDGQGCFGDYDDGPAAMRYTEARLSKYAELYLLDKEYLECTPMVPNYSDDRKEPIYLPSKIPNILVNGSEGIAVGVSQNTPSFTLDSVIKVSKLAIQSKLTPERMGELLELKFTYGGLIYEGDTCVADICKTGKERFVLVPEIDYNYASRTIQVKSLCPRLTFYTMKKGEKPNPKNSIDEALLTIDGVVKVLNESGLNEKTKKPQILLTINTNRNITSHKFDTIVDAVYSMLEKPITYNVAVTDRKDDGTIEFIQLPLFDLIKKWAKWRIAFEKKVILHKISKLDELIRKNRLIVVALDNIEIIKKSLDVNDPVAYLVKMLKIKESEAAEILELKIRQLTKLERQKVLDMIKQFQLEIAALNKDLSNPVNRIVTDMEKLSKAV
jgi:DNA gyrase subunit A